MKGSFPAALALAVLLPSARAGAADPVGALEAADCVGVRGWAQDPDQPVVAIDVHVYFNGPPGDPAGTGIPVTAKEQRDDLCMVLGSCEHGYLLELPLGVRDGVAHNVWVYGIDLEQVNNPLLGGPIEVSCPAPPIVGGVKRWITAPEVLTAWQFSTFVDLLRVADVDVDAVPESDPWPAAPMLATSAAGDGVLWMIDGETRREVPEDVATAWRFAPETATLMTIAQLDAMPQGPDLRVRPFLVQGATMPAVYLLDEVPCEMDGCPQDGDSSGGELDTGDETAATDASSASAGEESGEPGGADTGTSDDGAGTDGAGIDPSGEGGPEPTEGCGCGHAPSANALWCLLVLALQRRAR